MLRLGVISDTHDYLDPQIIRLFDGVDHILHAGDIGCPAIIHRLEEIAPTTAVLGNNDDNPAWRETEVLEFEGLRALVHHILTPERLSGPIGRRIQSERPAVVVYGHTHEADGRVLDGTLFLNPGYAGSPGRATPRSVAFIEWKDGRLTWRHCPLK